MASRSLTRTCTDTNKLEQDVASLTRVRNRLANVDDAALPRTLTGLLPRLLSKLDCNAIALLSDYPPCTSEEIQLRSQIQTHLLGILSHAMERVRGNEFVAVPWIQTVCLNLLEAQRHVTRTMAAALLKVALPRIKDIDTLSNVLACLFQVVDLIHRVLMVNPTEAYRMDSRSLTWLCWDTIAQMYQMPPMQDLDLVYFDSSSYRGPDEDVVAATVVIEAVGQDGAGVFDAFYDMLLYQSEDIQLQRGTDRQRPGRHYGLSTEGSARMRHRRTPDQRKWNEHAQAYLKQLKVNCFMYAVASQAGALFSSSEKVTTFKRSLILIVLFASNNSKVGGLASACFKKYVGSQRIEKQDGHCVPIKGAVCDLSMAVSLLVMVLGDNISMQVLKEHQDQKPLWEDLLGPRPTEDSVKRLPLLPTMATRAVIFVARYFSVIDNRSRKGLRVVLDLVVEVQKHQGRSAFAAIHLVNGLLRELQQAPNYYKDMLIPIEDFRALCFDVAKGVIKSFLDPETPIRAQNVLNVYQEGLAAGLEGLQPGIIGELNVGGARKSVNNLLANHRRSQRRKSRGLEEAVEARKVAYSIIASFPDEVKAMKGDNEFSFDIPIMLLMSAQNEDSFVLPYAIKALNTVRGVYTKCAQECAVLKGNVGRYNAVPAGLLPALLESICSDSPSTRMAGLRWISDFLQCLDPLATLYLLNHLSEDQDPGVAKEASKLICDLQQPAQSTANKIPTRFFCVDMNCEIQCGAIDREIGGRVSNVAAITQLPDPEAAALLRDQDFSLERIASLEHLESAMKASGIFGSLAWDRCNPVSSNDVTNTCGICYCSDFPGSDLYSLGCLHAFCRECWRELIQINVGGGRNHSLTSCCPFQACGRRVVMSDVLEIAPEVVNTWQQHLREDFVDKDPLFALCPGPDCKMVIWSETSANVAVDCKACNTEFCFQCGDQPHAPAKCSDLTNWHRLFGDSKFWIVKNTKSCPRCNVAIEKNHGCNHMRCTRCGFNFCWICLAHLATYLAPHDCNRFEILDDSDANQNRRNVFYTERFQAHEEAELFAKDHVQLLDAHLKKIANRLFPFEEEHAEIVVTVRHTLLNARCFLKYSYVAAFGTTTVSAELKSFEQEQGALELFVEKLTRMSQSRLELIYAEKGERAAESHLRSMAFYAIVIQSYMARVESIAKNLNTVIVTEKV